MAQINEAQLFEMMGRLFAEVRALTTENEQLKIVVVQLQEERKPKAKKLKE